MPGLDDTLSNIESMMDKQNKRKEEKTKGTLKKFLKTSPTKNEEKKEFILKPKRSKPELIRKTHYLTQELIEGIDEISKVTGYDKSEVVRIAIKTFINNIDIKIKENDK